MPVEVRQGWDLDALSARVTVRDCGVEISAIHTNKCGEGLGRVSKNLHLSTT